MKRKLFKIVPLCIIVLAISMATYAYATRDLDLASKKQLLHKLQASNKSDMELLEQKGKQLQKRIEKQNGKADSETEKTMIENEKFGLKLKENYLVEGRLQEETGEFDYDKEFESSLNTLDTVIGDDALWIESSRTLSAEMKQKLAEGNQKKLEVYNKYLNLKKEGRMSAKEMNSSMDKEIDEINKSMEY